MHSQSDLRAQSAKTRRLQKGLTPLQDSGKAGNLRQFVNFGETHTLLRTESASRRSTAARLNVLCPLPSVIFRTRQFGGDLTARNRLIKQTLQKRATPAATGSRPETVAQLPHALRLLNPQKVSQLSFRDVKTKTNLSIFIRHELSWSSSRVPSVVANQPDQNRYDELFILEKTGLTSYGIGNAALRLVAWLTASFSLGTPHAYASGLSI
jgi:hypothetical protein